MKLWVFGHSSCLPFNIPNGVSWAKLVAHKLNVECKNFAEAAADNLFIYHCFKKNLEQIQSDDIVIVGWSHPSRKSFVLDQNNPAQLRAIDQGCMIFDSQPKFFRSKGTVTDTKQKWAKMIPQRQGNSFFDKWFENYYNDYECRLNFQAYCDSVQLQVPCKYIPFYFSKESIDCYTHKDTFYWLDFVVENQCWISKNDMHPNQQGHNEMAKIFLQKLDL